ncbi:hypothetical protein TNCV_3356221 [Trichonephila clavipes]|nr:hypothetical protein TNCV_3356221 [Trichonephila clavipes]
MQILTRSFRHFTETVQSLIKSLTFIMEMTLKKRYFKILSKCCPGGDTWEVEFLYFRTIQNYGFDSWCCYCPVATLAQWSRYQTHGRRVMSLTPGPPNTCHAEWADARFICRCSNVLPLVWCEIRLERGCQLKCRPRHLTVVRNYEIVRVHYFVRGGFVGHRSRASSKHLSPHLPVGSLDSSGGSNRGCAASEAARVGVESTKKPTPDVVVFET